jgi:Tfp pilus assembly PilM family ATPase
MASGSPRSLKVSLQVEYVAARTELERAELDITSLADAGFPIEHMDLEFQAQSRARATLNRIQEKLRQLDGTA